MKLDDAVRQAFSRELDAVPERRPTEAEISRVCGGPAGSARGRRAKIGDFIPALALAAALMAFSLSGGPENSMRGRPLACLLAESIPEDAGIRLEDFFLSAGKSLRSVD